MIVSDRDHVDAPLSAIARGIVIVPWGPRRLRALVSEIDSLVIGWCRIEMVRGSESLLIGGMNSCRLSESPVWQLQRAFYESEGLAAWRFVPQFVTCNRLTAWQTAVCVMGMVEDMVAQKTTSQQLILLEVGCGSGKFAFHLLHHLQEMTRVVHWAKLLKQSVKLTLVLSDFVADNVLALAKSSAFQPFVEQGDHSLNVESPEEGNLLGYDRIGMVDFAVLDAVNPPQEMKLLKSGRTLSPGQCIVLLVTGGMTPHVGVHAATPVDALIVIANYVLDSIPQDSFAVEDQTLLEGRVELQALPHVASKTISAATNQLSDIGELKWSFQPVGPC